MPASKYFIMNEKAVRWSLNSPDTGIFTAPSGFGYEFDGKYLSVGDRWAVESNDMKQRKPSGKIIFPKKPYQTFRQFIDFLNSAKELTLIYQPAGIEQEFFADIDLTSIEKGYFTKGKALEVPIKFVCRSLFYTTQKFEYKIERDLQELRWDFKWETKFNDLQNVNFLFNNTGHAGSPFVISFTGYCMNPIITVYNGGELVHQIPFNIELEADETLKISTFDDDLFIEVNGQDRRSCLNLANENFFKLPVGESQIFFRSEAGKVNNILITFEKYYRGV